MSETSKIFGHFNVRILRKGEKYGLEDCLIHNGFFFNCLEFEAIEIGIVKTFP